MAMKYQIARYRPNGTYPESEWQHISRRDARRKMTKHYLDEEVDWLFDRLDAGAIEEIDCQTYGKIRKKPRKKRGRKGSR